MSTPAAERPNRIPWPPLIYLVAVAIGAVLAYFVELPWIPPPFSDIAFAAGWLMVAAAIAIDVLSMRQMHRARTTILPTRGAEHLVTGGPFALSRNPIYLANTMIVLGIGLISGVAWFLLLAILAAYATQKLAIEREEHHLGVRFGKHYRDYCKRVKRWI